MRDVVVIGWSRPPEQRIAFIKRVRAHRGTGVAHTKQRFEKLVSLCLFCCLDGRHDGRLRVCGSADHATWTPAPKAAPAFTVHGRKRAALSL